MRISSFLSRHHQRRRWPFPFLPEPTSWFRRRFIFRLGNFVRWIGRVPVLPEPPGGGGGRFLILLCDTNRLGRAPQGFLKNSTGWGEHVPFPQHTVCRFKRWFQCPPDTISGRRGLSPFLPNASRRLGFSHFIPRIVSRWRGHFLFLLSFISLFESLHHPDIIHWRGGGWSHSHLLFLLAPQKTVNQKKWNV